jgi:hypothetical protein
MAQLDADAVGGAVARMDSERAVGMARLAGRLGEHGMLRDGLSAKEAEHILWMLTSFESFDSLYTGRRLSTGRAVSVLTDAAERALYTEPYDPR